MLSAPGLLFFILGCAALTAPYMTLAANRIVAGDGFRAWQLAAPGPSVLALGVLAAGLAMGVLGAWPTLRVIGAALGLGALIWLLTLGSTTLLDGAGEYARVSPAAGFWCLVVVLALLLADGLTNLSPGPWARLGILGVILGLLAALLTSGLLSHLSIMQEFSSRKPAFFDALSRHLWLSLGSLLLAAIIGLPLGIACYRKPRLQDTLLPALSFLQTIPSLAMFGIMIPLLGWVGDTVPGAQAIGIAGIGFAPAFIALVLYSLLPVVANTAAGLSSTPPAAQEAARGMGMTFIQRLAKVELPLGLPIILAGLRIVLVQNIGLAVIAGLIGGGGFGAFVFQGLNQTATDLILLGALPTVALALVAGVLMDILVALTQPHTRHVSESAP